MTIPWLGKYGNTGKHELLLESFIKVNTARANDINAYFNRIQYNTIKHWHWEYGGF
jgi:hypothetical protein